MMSKTKALLAMAAVGLLTWPAMASAQMGPGAGPPAPSETADDVDEVPEDQMLDEVRAWSVGASVGMRMSQGTFVSPANDSQWADDVHDGSGAYNRVSMNFGISPSYQWEDFLFSGELSYSQYLSAGGGIIEPYEGRLGDLSLAARHEGWSHEGSGITVSPSVSFRLPTSSTARAQTQLLGTSASLGVSRTFLGELMLSYSVGGSRGFHRYTSPVMDIDEIGAENALYRTDGAESIDPTRFAVAGVNTKWGLTNTLSAGISLSSRLMAMVNWTLMTSWSYDVIDTDEFSSQYECDGGRCSSQASTGMINLSYILNENMSMSFGVTTGQSPRTSDQKSFSFPFYNFSQPGGNNSSFSLGLRGQY